MRESFERRYHQVMEDIAKASGQARKWLSVGFTSNLDQVLGWDPQKMSELLQIHCTRIPEQPRTFVHTPEELLSDIAWYLKAGRGGELEIEEAELCDFFRQHFRCEDALGGTGVQAAAALAAAGIRCFCHPSDRSREVYRLLDYPAMRTVEGEKVVQMGQATPVGRPMCHFIVQFLKGDRIYFAQEDFIIPNSNRLIITYDTLNEDLRPDPGYLRYVENHAEEFSTCLYSGINCVTPEDRLARCLEGLEEHAQRTRANHPGIVLFLEDAHYHYPELHRMVYQTLPRHMDVMGMNEDEFQDVLDLMGMEKPHNAQGIARQALRLREKLRLRKGLIVHTKDWAMFIGDRQGLDPERALISGNLFGTSRARLGKYASVEEIADSLEVPLSETGLALAREMETFGEEIAFVPAKCMERPTFTVGLGDCFTAGILVFLARE